MKIDIGTEERLKQLAVEISRIDETTDESPYERIVIQYPFPLLEVKFWRKKNKCLLKRIDYQPTAQ